MALRVRKIRRQRAGDELVVEQTQDLAGVNALLVELGLPTVEFAGTGNCCLTARFGARMVGVASIRSRIDAALLTIVAVAPEERRRGVGTALVTAARAAAHARGALSLYVLTPPAAEEFFAHRGFVRTSGTAELTGLVGTSEREPSSPEADPGCTAWLLDISLDGIVAR